MSVNVIGLLTTINILYFNYSGPTAGLRAVRLLHDLEVAGKKLVAKVDAKNKLLLDNYREEEVQTNEDDEKREDESALSAIERIIADHHEEIENFESIQEGMHWKRNR